MQCYETPNPSFLLPRRNGCAETFRSYTSDRPIGPEEGLEPEELVRMLQVPSWFPDDVFSWMRELPYYHEDEHAIYVHAGLEGEGTVWMHPSAGKLRPLLWMREPDFYKGYHGKCVVFGHTVVSELPIDHMGALQRLFHDPKDVWVRGDLVGIDTGCGKGGFLTALELPAMRVYESR